jgi:hypothetical protein
MAFKSLQLCALAIVGFTQLPAAQADNYKKDYCGNETYVTAGAKYPHLHCDKDFLVYSADKSNHKDLGRGDTAFCERTRATIDTIKALPDVTVGKPQMLASTLAFARVHCKK